MNSEDKSAFGNLKTKVTRIFPRINTYGVNYQLEPITIRAAPQPDTLYCVYLRGKRICIVFCNGSAKTILRPSWSGDVNCQ